MPYSRRHYFSMEQLYADLLADGECLVCQKALPILGPNRPYSIQATIPDAPNDETHIHRLLFRIRYPDDDIAGWTLVRACDTKGCVKAEHYRKALYYPQRR